jgi:uncharacterized protein (DUF2141 family)
MGRQKYPAGSMMRPLGAHHGILAVSTPLGGMVAIRRGVLIAALVAAAVLAADSSRGQPRASCTADPGLTVSGTITGFQPGKTVYLALYRSSDDFQAERYCRNERFLGADQASDTIRFEFSGLPVGEYLIASYQDIDGDGKMTRGLLGMPKDPYRIYRPNYGMFGPKFDKCKFTVEDDVGSISIDYTRGRK